ncbi:MAG: DUF2975 domain-containing protein [Lachnospiraceae bacterium]|nr:DUF2975 domain-containing protein [Lachnospiraceae bacterium]
MEQKTFAALMKFIIIGAGIFGAFICFYVFPACADIFKNMYPEFSGAYWPWLVFLWISAIPCFCVLFFGWKISTNIGNDKSFSMANAKWMKLVAWMAAGDSAFFFVGNVILLFCNMNHPGILLMSMVVVFAGIAIAVAAACLSHLIRKAAVLQDENDLTI